MNKIPITVIVGATAVGKTAYAIDLAQKMDAEIVSADSRYFYRGMDIGTAKPTLAERCGVPHHLIDVANPDDVWSLALFQQEAERAIQSIHSRGKAVLVVGGTGQYIRALLQGWEPPAMEPDLAMREVLSEWGAEIGAEMLHKKLALVDPAAAARIDYQNMRRTVRALEVMLTTGKRFSEQRGIGESPYQAKVIGLRRDRSELYQRIDQRIDLMIQTGLLDEVASLLRAGYSSELPAMSAIGYREICGHLNGTLSLEEAIELIKRRTRNFVRRQANWFKESDAGIEWIDLTGK